MLDRIASFLSPPGLRRRITLSVVATAAIWVLFFDSHSLLRRYRWHRDADRLERQNESIQAEIADLSDRVQRGLSDDMVEAIAREQYGMRRPGETVYRVETER
ncbi:MAG: septum formation initiator family protein [Rhodothermales bacterium]